MMQDYFVIPFTRLRKFPCIPCLLRVLIMNGFCILLNVFSASFEISIYFFFFNLLMWWITLIDIELTLYYGASSDLLHGSFCCMDILLYGILEWVAISFSRGSSPPRDWTQVSCIAGRGFTLWATGKQLRLRHVIFIYKLMYLLIFFLHLCLQIRLSHGQFPLEVMWILLLYILKILLGMWFSGGLNVFITKSWPFSSLCLILILYGLFS